MKSIRSLLVLLVGSGSALLPVRAALSEVALADWATFTLDVDGDGVAEFAGSTSNLQNISLTNYADGNPFTVQNLPGTRPGQGTVRCSWKFASMGDLQADAIYAGSVSINPTVFGDLHMSEGAPVVFNANEAEPILAGWRFGTSGSGNDPLTIIGFVLDASEFFASGGSAPIRLHTHHFDSLSPGDPAIDVTLATALGSGGGDPPSTTLASTVLWTGPKSGTITVESTLGKTYQLWRTTNLVDPTLVDTQAGNGDPLEFSFDESGSSDPKAFFYVSES